MQFRPVTQERLVTELAAWTADRIEDHVRIGIDGPEECGAAELADLLAGELAHTGRSVVRASTKFWWRPAALRLKGRTDLDALLGGWVDTGALRRELTGPLGSDGSGTFVTQLRDPQADRSIRQQPETVAGRSVLVVDGPFLLTLGLEWDGLVALALSKNAITRALPPERQWWLPAFDRYADWAAVDQADFVVSYDHPRAPAIATPAGR